MIHHYYNGGLVLIGPSLIYYYHKDASPEEGYFENNIMTHLRTVRPEGCTRDPKRSTIQIKKQGIRGSYIKYSFSEIGPGYNDVPNNSKYYTDYTII